MAQHDYSIANETGLNFRTDINAAMSAIVSASGKIDPKKTVNISAQSMGRVTRLAVNEGDRVTRGHDAFALGWRCLRQPSWWPFRSASRRPSRRSCCRAARRSP